MGGEKVDPTGNDWYTQGSPPRRRGKDSFIVHCHACVGITPAWAGKSRRAGRCAAASGDHPRVGGEKLLPSDTLFLELGSPPHGRGKDVTDRERTVKLRITLAWAGKRSDGVERVTLNRDHPRVGGEKERWCRTCHPEPGSPPRRRGKVHLHPDAAKQRGITPAWAGKRFTTHIENSFQ